MSNSGGARQQIIGFQTRACFARCNISQQDGGEALAADDYELVSQELDAERGLNVLVLCKAGKDTFLDELAAKARSRGEVAAIVRAAVRLVERGTEWALEAEQLKRLKAHAGTLAVYELRVKRDVYRVMTYVHDNCAKTPVQLFEFRGHAQRAAGGIPESTVKKGQQFAAIARELMLREEEDHGKEG